MSAYRSLSLWHDTLPADDQLVPRPALGGDTTVDVAIVGGGFTGCGPRTTCWRQIPTIRIAIIERDIAGFGASGRNGGWASALLPMSLDTMATAHGRDAAVRMQREMYHSVDEVGRAPRASASTATTRRVVRSSWCAPRPRIERPRSRVDTAARFGLDESRGSTPTRPPRRRGDATCSAPITPALRGRPPGAAGPGLAAAASAPARTSSSRPPVEQIEPRRVTTDRGTVRADVVVRATEGFTPSLAARSERSYRSTR